MQQFAEIIDGMSDNQILAIVPDPLPQGKVTLSVPDPHGSHIDPKFGCIVTSFEFKVPLGISREKFAESVHMACCDWLHEGSGSAEEPPSPEALQQFSETAEFQGLFQFRFEEAANFQRIPPFDLHFPKTVNFTFDPAYPRYVKGRFTGQVEIVGEGVAGETSGSFRLELKHAVGSGPAAAVLADAILQLKTYRFPRMHPAPAV